MVGVLQEQESKDGLCFHDDEAAASYSKFQPQMLPFKIMD